MIEKKITEIFLKNFEENLIKIEKLPESGSNRIYFRIFTDKNSYIGAYNPIKRENEAFFHFTDVFLSLSLNVPTILHKSPKNDLYILQDLGNLTVFEYIITQNENAVNTGFVNDVLKNIIDNLIQFQISAYSLIDFSKAFPRDSFDKQSIMWDLNYFKYYFLKLVHKNFDEQLLEDDFENFSQYLLNCPSSYFMYRDFQSRNIMMHNNELYFIDYQGGRKGPLQYDLASLLFSSSTNLPQNVRDEMLDYYISKVSLLINKEESKTFSGYYYAFVLVRIMQAFGAYGYRGLFERKQHFIKSIPIAISNLKFVIDKIKIPVKLPELFNSLEKVIMSEEIDKLINIK